MPPDPYDNNGNLKPPQTTNPWDFENHLVQDGNVSIVYDGDGNRVAETVAGITTKYLVDDVNPTRLPQVVDELVNGSVARTYAYGLQRISENQLVSSVWTPSFYGYDGHGSVRFLTNANGSVTDAYEYDAFGNLHSSTGSTHNKLPVCGRAVRSCAGNVPDAGSLVPAEHGTFYEPGSPRGRTLLRHELEPVHLYSK